MITKTRLKKLFRSFYLVPYYRLAIVRLRILWFVYIRRQLKFFASNFAFETTIKHNIKGIKYCNNRIELLIKPLSVLETIDTDSQALIIGPRNEHDLYCLIGNGFEKKNVRGLDLISYSPRIDLGDMHATPYPQNRFDVVIVGWTLSYSKSPDVFASEMLRILKDGGVLAIGVEYSTMSEDDEKKLMGYAIQEFKHLGQRINSVSNILELFSGHVKDVYFSHDAPKRMSHSKDGLISNVSNVAVIFSIKK